MIDNLPSQVRVHQLLKKQSRTDQENQQLIIAIKKGGYDMPDVSFSNAYKLIKNNKNKSDQKYINTEQLIINAIKIKIPYASITKYIQHFASFIGKNKYLQKMKALSILYKNNQPNQQPLRQIMKEDQSDLDTKKRILTAYKKQGKLDQYIREMKKFLQVNSSDTEAWIELTQIYTQKGLYMRAIFCMQEVIVIHPQNEHYMIKLAQLYVSQGGKQNLKAAIKYYSHVISRCPYNLRALWGLYRVLQGQKDKIQAQHIELKELCKQTINSLYSKKNSKVKLHVAF